MPRKPDEGCTHFTIINIPVELHAQWIDHAKNKRRPKTSLNAWLIEAAQEKLVRERKKL